MSWGNIIPAWMIMMPFDQWQRGEITDAQLLEWLEDEKNGVPDAAIENWRYKLTNNNNNKEAS